MQLRHLLEQGLRKTANAAQLGVGRRVICHWRKTGQINRELDGPVPRHVEKLGRTKLSPFCPIISTRSRHIRS